MANQARIIDIRLDTSGQARINSDLAVEQHRAVSDLLAENRFSLKKADTGPYFISLSVQDDRMTLNVTCRTTKHNEIISLALTPFRKHLQDYTILLEGFYNAARAGENHKLEALDAGRRGIHDESAELLAESLEGKAEIDKATARRIFTLLYVLHTRGKT